MPYIALMLVAAAILAIQSPVNAALSHHTGSIEAGFVSFFTGAVFLFFACLFFGKGSTPKACDAPSWQWPGGMPVATVVCSAILSVPRTGILSTSLAMILGNLAMPAVIDNFGWFDAPCIILLSGGCPASPS